MLHLLAAAGLKLDNADGRHHHEEDHGLGLTHAAVSAAVAAISHVPHLLSTALVHVVSDNDDEEKHMQLLAAGCFRDMSRVAASSPEMWEQICLTNSSAISNILEQYIEMLETIKDNIDKKTPGYVASLFEMSREYRNSLESRHPEH